MKTVKGMNNKRKNINTHILIGVFALFMCMFIGVKDVKAADTVAELPRGDTFNLLLKQSVNSSIKSFMTEQSSTYVTKITFTTKKPTNYNKTSDKLSSYGVDIYINGTELYLYNPIGFKLSPNCYYMFYNFTGVKEINMDNISTSNVINMDFMFYGCKSLTVLDVSKWDTSNVTGMKNYRH